MSAKFCNMKSNQSIVLPKVIRNNGDFPVLNKSCHLQEGSLVHDLGCPHNKPIPSDTSQTSNNTSTLVNHFFLLDYFKK